MEAPPLSSARASLAGSNVESNCSKVSNEGRAKQIQQSSSASNGDASSRPTSIPPRVLVVFAEVFRDPVENLANDEGLLKLKTTDDVGESAEVDGEAESEGTDEDLLKFQTAEDIGEPTVDDGEVVSEGLTSEVNKSMNDISGSVKNRMKRKIKAQEVRPETEEQKKKKKKKCDTTNVCNESSANNTISETKEKSKTRARRKTFTCDLCEYKINRKYLLDLHKKTVHEGTGEKLFDSGQCDFHNYVKTSNIPSLNSQVNSNSSKDGHNTGGDPYLCSICDFRADSALVLGKHATRHSSEVNKSMNDISGSVKNRMKRKLKAQEVIPETEEQKKKKCDTTNVCNESSANNTISETKEKSKTRARSKTFTCDLCEYKINRKYRLDLHKKTVHEGTGEKLLDSGQCDFHNYVKTSDIPSFYRHVNSNSSKDGHNTGGDPYLCSICDFRADSALVLGKHATIHSKDSLHSCKICGYRGANDRSLTVHMTSHVVIPYMCQVCDYRCSQRVDLKEHSRTHIESKPESGGETSKSSTKENSNTIVLDAKEDWYIVVVDDVKKEPREAAAKMARGVRKKAAGVSEMVSVECAPNREWVMELAASSDATASSISKNTSPGNKKEKNEKSRVRKNIFTCALCEQEFDRKSRLIRHLKKHTGEKPYVCDECDYKSRYKHNLTNHKLTHSDVKSYACDECRFETNSKISIEVHKRIHKGEKPFVCDKCDYKSSNKYMLTSHKVTHSDERRYSCDNCPYKGKNSRALKSHVKTHTKEKSYKCSYCDYATYRSVDLKKHTRSHTGEKPYACDRCNYTCAQRTYLNVHMRIHTGEKPFACTVCDFKCRQATHLKLHMTIHTGKKLFPCKICDYSTSISSHFKDHMRIHTEERPYFCDTCPQRFREGNHLKRHMLAVHQSMPYRCDACGYKCNIMAVLADHLRKCGVSATGASKIAKKM